LPEAVVEEIEKTDMKLLGTIPIDEKIIEYALAGKSILFLPYDSPSKSAIKDLLSQIKGFSTIR
jgi:CO dehydrogenase maturation factor